MNVNAQSRFRKREQTLPFASTFPLGKLTRYLWISPGVWSVNPVQTINISSTPTKRPTLLERTWDETRPKPYNDGGPFTNVKVRWPQFEVRGSGTHTSIPSNGVDKWKYQGGFTNPDFVDTLGESSYFDDLLWAPNGSLLPDISSLGAQAYARMRPDLPKAPFAEMLGEGRDIMPMMRQTARLAADSWRSIVGLRRYAQSPIVAPKRAADEFLNQNFGWIPFVSGLNQIIDTTIFMEQYLHDLTAGNGQWMRKGKRLGESLVRSNITQYFDGGFEPAFGDQLRSMCNLMTRSGSSCRSYSRLDDIVKTESWAVGWFKYYRPEFDMTREDYHSNMNKISRAMTLYGLRISPSLVWELTPWSWLADYFVNFGQVIDNMTAVALDGVAAKQFFVMHHKTHTLEFTSEINFHDGPINMVWQRQVETKQRADADNPFSFRLQGALTPKQIAIMTALGISRA